MDRAKLKAYAPKARRDFIRAMTDRAAYYGLTSTKIEPLTEKGDVALIAGKAYPVAVAAKRRLLEQRIKREGFEQTMEAMAYTWFNRFAAIRFMEIHGYLDHGYRVLSHPEGNATPEIVEHAEHVDLPGLDKNKVIELKLDGTKGAELYRMLLIAECNALHSAMPFLFEKIDDETELLLPDNLLHSDSLIRQLVNGIDEADWQEIEIIGWLYQFYISEKKDEVIGKVVKSEDIPAATQLFTPNWIVKYLVQNTLGRQWLATYPQSSLRRQMKYYIEPAEQTPEVQAQLKAITPTSLNPEELTLLDPACGSGHILVEAYDLFKVIYQERGYRAKDIPSLILQKNLFGLEIDDRAAQLAAFALMMKARADDRRIFDSEAKPHVLAFTESKGMNAADITHALNSPINKEETPPSEYLFVDIEEAKTPLFSKKVLVEKGHVSQSDIVPLLALFENAKTLGSLMQVPPSLVGKLPEIEQRLNDVLKHGDLTHAPAHVIEPLLQQARSLAGQYDAVVANPPYMGLKWLNSFLKKYVKDNYPDSKADLCTCFVERCATFANHKGMFGLVTMHGWMFLSSFEKFRMALLADHTLASMAHLGPRSFPQISGEVVQVTAFSFQNMRSSGYRPSCFRLVNGTSEEKEAALLRRDFLHSHTSQDEYESIPGSPIAYWVSNAFRECFRNGKLLQELAVPRQGMATSDNGRFLRAWHEVASSRIGFSLPSRQYAAKSGKKWFPYNKGGAFRKWYGNNIHLINWEDDGKEVFAYATELYGSPTRSIKNAALYFHPCVTWTDISPSQFGVRQCEQGFVFDVAGSSAFPPKDALNLVTGLLCSRIAFAMLTVLNPTLHFQVGNVGCIPLLESVRPRKDQIDVIVEKAVCLAQADWDSCETSWDFLLLPVLHDKVATLQRSQEAADAGRLARFAQMRQLEEENNRLFIEAYGLQEELSPEVPDDQITLYRPDRKEDIKRLLSYGIGCVMGRYSLDKPGLVYAHSGNKGFNPSQYKTFPADQDGIIPLTETAWFDDDATNRVIEFIGAAWPRGHLEENLSFIAESLGPNKGEQPRDTIRRYLAQEFFKDHLKTYKRRPIYWLFSSGKQRAFQCLVYLHRYNEGTLSRMRTEYVIPLQGKISARIEQLAGDIAAATSTAFRSKLTKERDRLIKQQGELQSFDEKLRHYADLRISLDLDDGVKVNYGKFGDLLAEVKAVTGGKEEE